MTAAIRAEFDDAGVGGWLHARRVDDASDEVVVAADEPVPIASLYKLAVAAVWAERVDAGDLDPTERHPLDPARRTAGPTGISTLLDPVEISGRDLVRLMITLSDNAAADHLLTRLGGAAAVTDRLQAWDLADLTVRHGTEEAIRIGQRDTGTTDAAAFMAALADINRDVRTSEYDAALASTATARALTGLLARLWTGAPGPGGTLVREALRQQVWPHRLRAGFPHDDVAVAGKTGTLGILRHEAGVIEYPGEVPVAVAVLTRAARPERFLPRVDAVIGRTAWLAVQPLRRAG